MIDLHQNGARWTVTLDRADKANALSVAMLTRLDEIFAAAQQTRDLRLLVVTGAGNRVFCAGADLTQTKGDAPITTHPIWESVSQRLANLPCLTIAALNGTLAGGGFGLALACDLRIAVPDARFFYPVLANGFLPQPSDVTRLIALIGPAKTKLILLAGQKLDAAEALEIGLIDRIVTPAQMSGTITELATAALNANESVLTAIKQMTRPNITPQTLQDCQDAVYNADPDALVRLRESS
jgi:enoyl-CoA hydratase/carnithine racemase